MIEKVALISFWVIGFCCTFWDEMIFGKVGSWLDERLPEYISKPLYGCFICACFWWGSAIYWIFLGSDVKEWFIVVVAAMGVNAALSKLFAREEIDIVNHY